MSLLSINKSRTDNSCLSSGEILRVYQQLNTPLGNFDTSQNWTVLPATPISGVLSEMHSRHSEIAVVVNERKELVGIFSKSDLLSRVVIPGLGLDQPISLVMTPKPVALETGALGYEAIVAMVQGGFHHVVLVEEGSVVGVVSEHDLFTLQQVSLGQIAAAVKSAENLEKVHSCAKDIRNLVEYLFMQGVAPGQITQIISTFNDQLIRRVIDLETAKKDLEDIRICWIIMGSQGRYEQTISTDQDNAIIFEHPRYTNPDQVRKWLIPVAQRVNQALDYIGFPLCKGNVMAGNPDCCLSLLEWKRKFYAWISEPTPDSLLKISIYFDFRALHGRLDLADELRIWLCDVARGQLRFLNQMAETALQKTPPLSWFSKVLHKHHSTDIKNRGIGVFVDAARIYALASGILSTKTHDRLLQSAQTRDWPESMVSAWTDSFNFLQGVRIRHHHNLHNNGLKTHNRLDLYKLNKLEQKVCTEAFRQGAKLQKQLQEDFINNLIRCSFAGA